jgi:integrase
LASMPARANRVCMILLRMVRVAGLMGKGTGTIARPRAFHCAGRQRYLTKAEAGRLIAVLDREPSVGSTIVRLLLLTGCRKSEILKLRWSETDLERRCLRLSDGKTGARVVPLSEAAVSVLAGLPRLGEFVFPGRCGSVTTFQRVWERLRAEAGLSDVRLHDLRHSFASFAVSAGVPLYTVGQVLGHRSSATTMRYAHVHPEAALAACDTVAAVLK